MGALLADGCAPSYRNHLLAEASAQCEASGEPPAACGEAAAAAYSSEVQHCTAAHAAAHTAHPHRHPLGLLPPATSIEEIGLMPQRSVWRNTAAVLGLEASSLSSLGMGSDTDTDTDGRRQRSLQSYAPSSPSAARDGLGTRFSRLAYRVTVGGVEYTASGLLSEATMGGDSHDGNASGRLGGRRGVFIWLHGSESLRAAALSRTVTAGADGLVTNPDGTTTLLALLAQLGYVVIAPDDLGLGVSSARHQVCRARHAYGLHRAYAIHLPHPPPCTPCPLARRT